CSENLKLHLPEAKLRMQEALHEISILITLGKNVRNKAFIEIYIDIAFQFREVEVKVEGLILAFGILPEAMLRTQKLANGWHRSPFRIQCPYEGCGYEGGDNEWTYSHKQLIVTER